MTKYITVTANPGCTRAEYWDKFFAIVWRERQRMEAEAAEIRRRKMANEEKVEIVKDGVTFSIKTVSSVTAQVPLMGPSPNSKNGIQQIWVKGEAEFVVANLPNSEWEHADTLAKKQMDATRAVAEHGCGWQPARDKTGQVVLQTIEADTIPAKRVVKRD